MVKENRSNPQVIKEQINNKWPSVTIYVLNWNGRSLLESCLPPLIQLDYPNYTITLIDNHSEDDSIGSALMAFATAASGRPVHLFDSWEGLPATTAQDGEGASKWAGECVGSPVRVMGVMNELKIDSTRLHFHRGWFHETFPLAEIPSIAMLHIDCDFYEPTVLCLETWYEHLSPGGFIQIDDYDCFRGSQQATNEFIARHPELELCCYEGRKGGQAYYFEKPAAIGEAPVEQDLVA